ncbi:MAG: hypothetical protein IPO66_21325 [Rhodanobacteraceae bacterium]|nr:hypothetical protein [Rhodanobacteraceae bacterium]
MTGRQREHQRQRSARQPWRWAIAVLLAWAPLATLASPVVPLQGVTLVSQGNFDRGCTQDAQSNDCQHGCAFVGERLYCWGDYFGALIPGAPSVTSLAEWVRRPDRPSGDFDRPVSLAVDGHSCVADAGGVWCWGPNQNGQLGVGDQAPRPQPTHLSGLPADIVQIALSPRHTCARSRSAGVWCWGANDQGQAGQPAAPQQLLPQRVPGLPAVVDHIALGGAHSCALADARVWCWGDNAVGQLGDGLEDDHSTAQLVSGLPANVSELDAGWRHTCALMSGGDIWCWGENASLCDWRGASKACLGRRRDCNWRRRRVARWWTVGAGAGASRTAIWSSGPPRCAKCHASTARLGTGWTAVTSKERR